MTLPTAFLIGAQKSGTSSLAEALDRHPEIGLSRPKEIDYFSTYFDWRGALRWYQQRFDPAKPVRIDASVNYAAHQGTNRGAIADRIKRLLPDSRLIYIVRDPIERILSACAHVGNEEGRILGDMSRLPVRHPVVWRSRYAAQLQPYLERFPRSSVHVVVFEDMLTTPLTVLEEIQRFLGVTSRPLAVPRANLTVNRRQITRTGILFVHAVWRATHLIGHVGLGFSLRRWSRRVAPRHPHPILHPPLSAEGRSRLEEFLRPDTEQFRAMTGLKFERWSI